MTDKPSPSIPRTGKRLSPLEYASGAAGAIAGGGLGYLLFYLLAQRGIIALVLPGACVGIGRSLFLTKRSYLIALLCLLLGLAIPLYIAEHLFAPGFAALTRTSQIAILASGAVAAGLGLGVLAAPAKR